MLQLSHHGRPNASVAAGAAARYCSAARIALSAHMHAALSRVCIVLGQVPDDWLLKPVSADLQIYTHSHAHLFDNPKTTVQLGRWQVGAVGDDILVAVKRTKRPVDGREEQRALREKKALHTLQHPNIVKCFGYAKDDDWIYVALEPFIRPLQPGQKAKSFTLEHLVKNNSASGGAHHGPLDHDVQLSVIRQVTEGVSYLHSKKNAHRDIKPNNILVRPVQHKDKSAPRFEVKLTDLEYTKEIEDHSRSSGGRALPRRASARRAGKPRRCRRE